MAPRRPKSSKNPPILSHEFFIQNHADIVSCVAMVFIAGLMFQATAPLASVFITMQHNVTVNDSAGNEEILYSPGSKDMFTISFYFLICIVIHAVIQEYILDKLNRKMHLSKIKHSKFNESGQLLMFFLISAVWGLDILFRENYITSVNHLWEGYPHSNIPSMVKFFFIIQISYWLHNYPELYLQKVRKEEVPNRVKYTSFYLVLIAAAFFLNFHRVALCMLVLHYLVEAVYHFALLSHYAEKLELAVNVFRVFDPLFVLVRLGIITLAVLTFWYGLAQSNAASMDFTTGNYNTHFIRFTSLAAVCLSQVGLMWNFTLFHLQKMKEKSPAGSKKLRSPSKAKSKGLANDELDALPEVDQNSATENGNVRSRRSKK